MFLHKVVVNRRFEGMVVCVLRLFIVCHPSFITIYKVAKCMMISDLLFIF